MGRPKYLLPKELLGNDKTKVYLDPEESPQSKTKTRCDSVQDGFSSSFPIEIKSFRRYLDHEGREVKVQSSVEDIEKGNSKKVKGMKEVEFKSKKGVSRRRSSESWGTSSSSSSSRSSFESKDEVGYGWEAEILGLQRPENTSWWN